ncbi:Six-hairpin glycosidase, partial [Coniochaeta ligniaria NRRL 30616]
MGEYIPDFDEVLLGDSQARAGEQGTMLPLCLVRAALVCLLAAEISSCIPLMPATGPQHSPGLRNVHRDASGDNNTWHKYVRAPSSETVTPKGIVSGSLTGSVSNPSGLVNGDGATVLSRLRSGDPIPSLVVDFGQNLAGFLDIKLKGSSNSSNALPGLRLAFSETLQFLTNRSDFTRSDNADSGDASVNRRDQIAVQPKQYTWTDKLGCEYGTKVCSDGLHGFRYVKISLEALPEDSPYTTSFGTVSISSVSLTYSGFLGTPDTFTGWFECSDEDLTQWWYDGVYTNDLTTDIFRKDDTEPRQALSQSLLGKLVLHDGAKRDRDPYVGDVAVSALTSYLSHDTPEAARNVLADLAEHQRDDGWIPPASIRSYTLPLFDYPLWWVVCSYNHVLHTGDTAFLTKYYPVLLKVLDVYYPSTTSPSTSLLIKPPGYGDYAFLPRSGAGSYYNALYVLALRHAAVLAETLSNSSSDAARWRARADNVSASLLSHNWDSASAAFLDGSPCPGSDGSSTAPLCATHPQDANALAILAGVTPSGTARAEGILAYLQGATALAYGNAFFDNDALLGGAVVAPLDAFSTRVYAFLSFFDLSARLASPVGATVASGFDQLRRLYGTMARSDPGVTMWEGISGGGAGEPYEGAFTSMCHGWSTGVVPLLSRFVLGVRPTGVGFRTWEVRVLKERGGVSWARGAVPTPRGPIEVSWRDEGGLQISVSAPAGTTGEVYVPVGDEGTKVVVDGAAVYGGGEVTAYEARFEDGYVVLKVGSGSHEVSV